MHKKRLSGRFSLTGVDQAFRLISIKTISGYAVFVKHKNFIRAYPGLSSKGLFLFADGRKIGKVVIFIAVGNGF